MEACACVSFCWCEGQVSACLEHAVNELHMDRWQYRRELNVRVFTVWSNVEMLVGENWDFFLLGFVLVSLFYK